MSALAAAPIAPGSLVRALLTPTRPVDAAPLRLPGDGSTVRLERPSGTLAGTQWGDGSTVLLLHGCSGRRDDHAAFVAPLLARQRRVVAIDLPARGASSGDWTSIPAAAHGHRRSRAS